MSKILAVIAARGESKGLPRKNLRLLAGKPLIVHTISAALEVGDKLFRVVVSTDDEEIAEISRAAGADVPFLRPAELATDVAPSLGVVQHAALFIERQHRVRIDWTMLLQPTTPLRDSGDIAAAISLAEQDGCDSVVSVWAANHVHPYKMQKIDCGWLKPFVEGQMEGVRRQDYTPHAYLRNGGIYMTRRNVLFEGNSLYGVHVRPYIMPGERSVDIDDEIDLKLAELLIARNETCGRAGNKRASRNESF